MNLRLSIKCLTSKAFQTLSLEMSRLQIVNLSGVASEFNWKLDHSLIHLSIKYINFDADMKIEVERKSWWYLDQNQWYKDSLTADFKWKTFVTIRHDPTTIIFYCAITVPIRTDTHRLCPLALPFPGQDHHLLFSGLLRPCYAVPFSYLLYNCWKLSSISYHSVHPEARS